MGPVQSRHELGTEPMPRDLLNRNGDPLLLTVNNEVSAPEKLRISVPAVDDALRGTLDEGVGLPRREPRTRAGVYRLQTYQRTGEVRVRERRVRGGLARGRPG